MAKVRRRKTIVNAESRQNWAKTIDISTTLDLSYFEHFTSNNNIKGWCKVNIIPNYLLFLQKTFKYRVI